MLLSTVFAKPGVSMSSRDPCLRKSQTKEIPQVINNANLSRNVMWWDIIDSHSVCRHVEKDVKTAYILFLFCPEWEKVFFALSLPHSTLYFNPLDMWKSLLDYLSPLASLLRGVLPVSVKWEFPMSSQLLPKPSSVRLVSDCCAWIQIVAVLFFFLKLVRIKYHGAFTRRSYNRTYSERTTTRIHRFCKLFSVLFLTCTLFFILKNKNQFSCW